jgi:adenylate kinase family enzyme
VARVLVTGMSGTGKSTVAARLAERGHQVLDADDEGWSHEVATADGVSREQLWREDRMDALLTGTPSGSLFVAGCASNQGRFYDRFDAVVLLSVPVEVLLVRLASRATNAFGKDPAERERILEDLAAVEPLLRTTATAELDTRRPMSEVLDAIEDLARRLGGRGAASGRAVIRHWGPPPLFVRIGLRAPVGGAGLGQVVPH